MASDTKRAEHILDQLGFDFDDYSLERLVAHIEQRVSRSIQVFPLEMAQGYFGAWLSDKDAAIEYIFFSSSLSPFHQEHTILHELAHFILGHPTLKVTLAEVKAIVALLEPVPDAAALRGGPSSPDEQEAEELAEIIWTKVMQSCTLDTALSSLPGGKHYLSSFAL